MKSRALPLLLLAWLFAAGTSFSDVIHVPDEAQSISEAIEDSAPGDTVLIADGEYGGGNNYDLVVDIPLTIMSENGQDGCIIDCGEDNAEYCFNIQADVSIIGISIVGFQRGISAEGVNDLLIEDCFVTGSTVYGIGVIGCTRANIIRCDISDNNNPEDGMAGAGLYLDNSDGIVDQCMITENTSLGRGAGIWAQNSGFLVQNSSIIGNISRMHGGGILITAGLNFELRHCVISGNVTEGFEGTRANGGAIALTSGSAIVDNCIITGNSAPNGSAGGFYVYNGGDDCTILNSIFSDNEASRNGGAILVYQNANCDILNCIIENNRTGIDGGGVAVTGGSTLAMGSCDIIGNEAGLAVDNGMGGGLYMGSATTPLIMNTIFNENDSDIGVQAYAQNAGQVTISFCLMTGGVNGENNWAMDALNVEQNIDEDPILADGRDPEWGVNGFYLGEDSPCIDAGSGPAADLGFGEMSTQADLSPDQDVLDIGYHYNVSNFSVFGVLSGIVLDAANDEPLEGAVVSTSLGQEAETNADGFWAIDEAFAMREFQITASFAGYSDSTIAELILEDQEEMEVNFGLLHPMFEITHNEVLEHVEIGEQVAVEMTISNAGNAPLTWEASLALRGIEDVEPWSFSQSINVGQIAEDNTIGGLAYGNNLMYVTAGGGDPNMVIVMDIDGDILDAYPQFGNSRDGMEDLTWDGELLWGAEDDMVYGFTPEGQLLDSWEGPFNISKYVAWDTDREVLWIAYTTSNIAGYNREGQRIVDNDLPRGDLRIYGLSYWAGDPDGHPLYILSRLVNEDSGYIYKMNPDDQDMLFVAQITLEPVGVPQSGVIANALNPSVMSFITIANASVNDGGDRIDFFQVFANTAWMAIEPEAGVVAPEEEAGLTLTLADNNFGDGDYLGTLTVTHNAAGGMVEIPITFSVGEGGGLMPRDLVVPFNEGWNLMSINVIPPEEMWERDEGPDVVLMTEQLRIDENNHHIEIFKNKVGQFYSPSWNFCNIPFWDLHEGYLVKVDEGVEATWNGVPIPPDSEIPLDFGWNIASYYPDFELDATAPNFYVLSSIVDNLIIAKDVRGRFMNPAFRFSNMDPWRETQGYMIKVDADAVLVYPDERNGRVADISPVQQSVLPISSENMSLLINSISGIKTESGDQVMAYDVDNNLVGVGTVDEQGRCGLAVWGTDLTVESTDGLNSGEAFELTYRNAISQTEFPMQLIKLHEGSGLTYETNAFTVLDVAVSTNVPEEYYLSQNYPNPFNSMTRLDYGLPEASNLSIKLFDMNGRLAATLVDGEMKAGHFSTVINGKNLASGIYWVKMESRTFKATRKIAMIK